MSLLSNLRVGARLALGFGLLLALVLVMGLYAVNRVNRMQLGVDALAQQWLPSTQQLAAMNESLNQMRRAELQMLLGGDAKAVADESARIDKQWTVLPGLLDRFKAATPPGERLDRFQAFERIVGQYRDSQSKLIGLLRDGKHDEAMAYLRGESRDVFRATTESIGKLGALNDQGAAVAQDDAASSYRAILWGLSVLVAVALALGAAVAWLMTRSLTQPLNLAAEAADRIADGDLRGRIESLRGDELGDLLRALARMQQALGDSLRTVRSSADSIATASAEVSNGSHDLSTRAEVTASSLQETSAAMQQVNETVQLSAASANEARELARVASGVAQRGGTVVAEVVTTMDNIQGTSRKVADIIGVIDGIAFQTNILALNAAVEAARAGEQGRGFAVVAGEVRLLAQRSAQAAREIKQLISGSVSQVDDGARLVTRAGSTMQEVVDAVHQVSGLIARIAEAAEAQSRSLGEIRAAISQLDGMTQQDAALVEESAAAAESLRDQADRLAGVVGRFRLTTAAA